MKIPCEDCIHYEFITTEASSYCLCSNAFNLKEKLRHDPTAKCEHFKDKSRFIKLPCNVGDIVYNIEDNLIKKWYIGLIDNTGEYWKCKLKSNKNKYKYDFRFVKFDDFGKTVFLTKKEAEARLKDR